MERRFVRAWETLESRVERGVTLRQVLARASTEELVAALGPAGESDPFAANLIATELLNRQQRAPFLGALIASLTTLLVLFALEWVFTGTPFLIEEATGRAYGLMAFSTITALVSWLSWGLWQGRFPRLRMRLREVADRRGERGY